MYIVHGVHDLLVNEKSHQISYIQPFATRSHLARPFYAHAEKDCIEWIKKNLLELHSLSTVVLLCYYQAGRQADENSMTLLEFSH